MKKETACGGSLKPDSPGSPGDFDFALQSCWAADDAGYPAGHSVRILPRQVENASKTNPVGEMKEYPSLGRLIRISDLAAGTKDSPPACGFARPRGGSGGISSWRAK